MMKSNANSSVLAASGLGPARVETLLWPGRWPGCLEIKAPNCCEKMVTRVEIFCCVVMYLPLKGGRVC